MAQCPMGSFPVGCRLRATNGNFTLTVLQDLLPWLSAVGEPAPTADEVHQVVDPVIYQPALPLTRRQADKIA